MKIRTFLVIFLFACLMLILGAALPQISAVTSNLEKNVIAPLQSLASLAATLIIIGLALLVLQRIWRLSQLSNLVMDTFNNASGNEDLDKALAGLGLLTRESLGEVLEAVLNRLNAQKALDNDKFPLPGKMKFGYLPIQIGPEMQLTNLLTSLKDVTSGEIKTAVQLLGIVFTPRGTKISTTLQSRGNTPETLGISFELIDLRGEQKWMSYTIWEPADLHSSFTPALPKKKTYAILASRWRRRQDSTHAIPEKKTLPDRYLALLEPAARWLAIEVAQRTLEANNPNPNYRAMLYNFIGSFHQASAYTFDKFPFFYNLAINDFTKAIEIESDWFQPYENLADTYVLMATRESKLTGSIKLSDQGIDYLYLALTHYDNALRYLSTSKSKQLAIRREAIEAVARGIRLGRCTALLLIGDGPLIGRAMREIEDISVMAPEDEKDGQMLYNLACWYGIAYSLGISNEYKETARRYVTYSLARDQNLWYWASFDPTLSSISDFGDWERLNHALKRKLYEIPTLPTLKGPEFRDALQDVLNTINWI